MFRRQERKVGSSAAPETAVSSDAPAGELVKLVRNFRSHDEVLRYVARFDANGKARVGVEAVREDHPLAALLPCDNVFAIESRWYRDNPLVIRGPGAGRDVTAGAIQSDINRLAQLL